MNKIIIEVPLSKNSKFHRSVHRLTETMTSNEIMK